MPRGRQLTGEIESDQDILTRDECLQILSEMAQKDPSAASQAAVCARGAGVTEPSPSPPPRDTAWAMSDENVEIVRRMVMSFNEQGIAAVGSEFLAEDVEFCEPPEQPGARVARGRQETLKFFAGFDHAWSQHRSEPEEIRMLDTDRVLLLSVERFRGRDGIEVAQPAGTIFTLQRGKVLRWQAFWNREAALEAAGLRE